MLLAMALRNLARNRRRSAITLASLAGGLGMLVFASGAGDSLHRKMIDAGVGLQAGHVVVQARGLQARPEAGLLVADSSRVVAVIARELPEAMLLRRAFLGGLLSSADASAAVFATAVEPNAERRVNPLLARVVAGAALQDHDTNGVVLGQALARTLAAEPGGSVALTAIRGGEERRVELVVRGLFRTGLEEVDGSMAILHLRAAQDLLGTGEAATQVALFLPDVRDSQTSAGRLRAALDRPDLEVLSWDQALPELREFVVLDDASLYVFLLFIAAIVALTITNTVLMSVLERTQELGVLRALGMAPARLAVLVLLEGLVLGAAGAVLGAGLGVLASWPMAVWGLDLRRWGESFEAAGVPVDTVLRSDLDPAKVLLFSACALLLAAVCSVLPALRAARVQPAEAMRAA